MTLAGSESIRRRRIQVNSAFLLRDESGYPVPVSINFHGAHVSERNQAILDHEVTTTAQAKTLAADILAWLIDERIIDQRQCDGCMGKTPCYQPGANFMKACGGVEGNASNDSYAAISALATNGMHVVTERAFIVNNQGRFDPLPCPHCSQMVPIDDFWNAGSNWCEGKTDVLQCPHCVQASALPQWTHPEAGFVVLAFEFWNWPPLADQFIASVRQRLGHRISVISGKS